MFVLLVAQAIQIVLVKIFAIEENAEIRVLLAKHVDQMHYVKQKIRKRHVAVLQDSLAFQLLPKDVSESQDVALPPSLVHQAINVWMGLVCGAVRSEQIVHEENTALMTACV